MLASTPPFARFLFAFAFVLGVAGCSFVKDDSGTVDQASTAGAETDTHVFGVNIDDPEAYEAEFDKARDLHAGWVRIWMWWRWIEREEGKFDWSQIDAQVAWARRRGLRVLATVTWMPPWVNGTDPNCGIFGKTNNICNLPPRARPDALPNFLKAAVNRYKDDIRHWGVWNEPNLGFWNGSPEDYVNFVVRPAHDTIKAIDPGASVVGPDLADWSGGGGDPNKGGVQPDTGEWVSRIGRAGGLSLFDVYSHHAYKRTGGDTVSAMKSFRSKVGGAGGPAKPYWMTEVGFDVGRGEPDQRDQVKSLLDGWSKETSWWKQLFYYRVVDRTSQPQYALYGSLPAIAGHLAASVPPAYFPAPTADPTYSANSDDATADVLDRIYALSQADNADDGRDRASRTMSANVWNWYYGAVTGEAAPGLGLNAHGIFDQDVTLDTWWTSTRDFVRLDRTRFGTVPIVVVNAAFAARGEAVPELGLTSIYVDGGDKGLVANDAGGEASPFALVVGGVRVRARLGEGAAADALISYVGPKQINFIIPRILNGATSADVAFDVIVEDRTIAHATAKVASVAPAVFTTGTDATHTTDYAGKGYPAGNILAPGGDAVLVKSRAVRAGEFLELYGTGFRNAKDGGAAVVLADGTEVPLDVTSKGVAGDAANYWADHGGLDQMNIRIPDAAALANVPRGQDLPLRIWVSDGTDHFLNASNGPRSGHEDYLRIRIE